MLRRGLRWLDDYAERALVFVFYSYFVLIILVEVVMRNLFNTSLHIGDETARHAFIWLTWIAASIAVKKRLHVSIGLLIDRLSRRGQFYLNFFHSALFALFCLYGLRYVAPVIQAQVEFGTLAVITGYPLYFAYFAIPVGYALMIIRIVQNFVIDIVDLRAGRELRRGAAII
jgi:C4-dicarboxylate transporter, DctQ subunit